MTAPYELTSTQRQTIREYLVKDVWKHINHTTLTDEQRNNPERMKIVAFEMEEIFKNVAATFGLCGMK